MECPSSNTRFVTLVIGVVCTAGLLGAGSQILRLLLRIPPHWQTITAFPIGLTEETLISEPIFKALYDVTSLKPLDKVNPLLQRIPMQALQPACKCAHAVVTSHGQAELAVGRKPLLPRLQVHYFLGMTSS